MTTKSRCSAPALAQPGHPCRECRERDQFGKGRCRRLRLLPGARGCPPNISPFYTLSRAADASEEILHVPHLSAVAVCGGENWEDVAAHSTGTQEWSTSDHSCPDCGVRWEPLFGLDLR